MGKTAAKVAICWVKSYSGIIGAILLSLILIAFAAPAHALQKPVEGYVFDGSEPLKEAQIKVLMSFGEGDSKITCLTYPAVFTDSRGYFMTNLANMRVLGNNYPCEDRWRKGDVLAVIAKGFYTALPDEGNPAVESESGATISLQKLVVTDRKFEPSYSELSLAKLKIVSLDHMINWGSKKIVFDAEIYNPNNVPLEEVFLKIVITRKDNKNDIVQIAEQKFGIDSFDTKEVQVLLDIKDMDYGKYSYNAVLYTPITTHDQILDRDLELKAILGMLTMQNIIILIMTAIIVLLAALLIRLRKGKERESVHKKR